jgi:hypothetical protein
VRSKSFVTNDLDVKAEQLPVPAKSQDGEPFVGFLPSVFRSGSQWLYYSFKDAYPEIRVHHEAHIEIMLGWPGLALGFKAAEWADVLKQSYGAEAPMILVVRDPVEVAISAHQQGIKRVDIALQQWVNLNQNVLEQNPLAVYRIEDIWADPNNLHDIARMLGLPFRADLLAYAGKKIGARGPAEETPVVELTPEATAMARLFKYIS